MSELASGILRAWFDCPMISPKCAALFPGSLVITIYNLDKLKKFDIARVMQNYCSKSFKTKDRRKVTFKLYWTQKLQNGWCSAARGPVISTQLLWLTDVSRIFLYQWKSTKICRKAKDDILLHFHVYLDTSKRTITQGTSAPEDFLPRGNFWPRKFSPRRLLSKKDPLCQGDLFVQEDVYLFGTIVQRHLCNKGHPMAKYVVWSRVLTKQKSDTWWLF